MDYGKKGLLFTDCISINDKIIVNVPKMGDVLVNQDEYNDLATMLTATPYDMMVQLDDVGIDFNQITDFELFILLFPELQQMDVSILLPTLDFSKFTLQRNVANGEIVLRDPVNNIVIDKAVHARIADTIRLINGFEKNNKRAGNEEARKFMIERARKKQRRAARKIRYYSQLDELLISLVNTEQFKYDFESVKNMTILQFNVSAKQVAHKIAYDNTMHGVYSGTVSVKDLPKEAKEWVWSF